MLFAAEALNAERARDLGLVSAVVPSESLMNETLALANTIAGKPPLAVKAAKLLLRAVGPSRADPVADLSIALQSVLHQTDDYRHGVEARLARIKVVKPTSD